jgi:hypothetical protein
MKSIVTGFAASLLLLPVDAVAQTGSFRSVWLEARAGYSFPSTDLGRTAVLNGVGYVALRRPDPAARLGVGVGFDLAGPFAARITADRTLEASVDGQWFCDAFSPCPAVLILVDGHVRLWTAAADLIFRPATGGWPLEPILFLGTGFRRYSLRWDSPIPEVPIATGFQKRRVFVRPGLGAELERGPWRAFAEVDAAIGGFGVGAPGLIEGTTPPDPTGEPRTQVDISVSAGLRLRVR